MAPMVRNATGRALGAALVLAVVAAACSGDDDEAEGAGTEPAGQAGQAGDGGTPADPGPWVVEAPEDHGLDPATLEQARDVRVRRRQEHAGCRGRA